MKKIAYYLIILLQVGIIAIIGWQYILIDTFSETITLTISKQGPDFYNWMDKGGTRHITYDINEIPKDRWDISTKDLQYNEHVYVLLEKDGEGNHVVKKASTTKLKQANDQITFQAKYMHDRNTHHEVQYGIEEIDERLHENINEKEPYSVVVEVAPWGQKKVTRLVAK